MSKEVCVLCNEGFDAENPVINVREKGLKTLVRLCREKDLDELCR